MLHRRRSQVPRSLHAVAVTALSVAALGGCSLLTGASDLTTDPGAPGSATATDAASNGERAASPDEGGTGEAGGVPLLDGGGTDADAGGGAPFGAGIRAITFESGTLTGKDGADTQVGSPLPYSMMPLRGRTSMVVTNPSSFVVASFPKRVELYVTFLFAIASPPDMNAGAVPIFRLDSAVNGATSVEVRLDPTAGVVLAVAGTSLSLGALTTTTVYRFGAHVTSALPGRLSVDAQVVEGALTPFGSKFAHVTVLGNAGFAEVSFGNLTALAITGLLDHVLLDGAAMPPP